MPHERMFPHAHAHKLDDAERGTFLPASEVLARLPLVKGMDVADVGAGTGYFALPIAVAIAPGRVLAVDVQQEMLDALARKMDGSDAPPITLVRADAVETTLGDRSLDLVLYANVWHELDDRVRVLAEAARILRDGGRIAIVDWRPDVASPPGPPLDHRLAPDVVARELREAGFAPGSAENVGRFSYVITARLGRR